MKLRDLAHSIEHCDWGTHDHHKANQLLQTPINTYWLKQTGPTLYAAFTDQTVTYIGITKHFPLRMGQHALARSRQDDEHWIDTLTSLESYAMPNMSRAAKVEQLLIHHLTPRFNKTHQPTAEWGHNTTAEAMTIHPTDGWMPVEVAEHRAQRAKAFENTTKTMASIVSKGRAR